MRRGRSGHPTPASPSSAPSPRIAMLDVDGYRDNCAPGERPHYYPGYHAALVFDPDGNNLESVLHERPAT